MNRSENLAGIRKQLEEAGLKVTHQRLVIYQALLATMEHPNAEQLQGQLQASNPSLSLGTIYKTLESFVNAGLIRKVPTNDGCMRYDARLDVHHHLYCSDTSEIIDYVDEDLTALVADYLARKQIDNFTVQGVSLHIHGARKATS
jgi:Fur family peroxide stress response transcriptional regulator